MLFFSCDNLETWYNIHKADAIPRAHEPRCAGRRIENACRLAMKEATGGGNTYCQEFDK